MKEQEVGQAEQAVSRPGRRIRWPLVAGAAAVAIAGVFWWFNRPLPPSPAQPLKQVMPPLDPVIDLSLFPSVMLKDVSAELGVDFVHENGAVGSLFMPEPLGSGGGFFDYDNDGDQDLAVAISGGVVLASNEGSSFRRRTVLATSRSTTSLAAADFDRDGRLDLYVCAYAPNSSLNDPGQVGALPKFATIRPHCNSSLSILHVERRFSSSERENLPSRFCVLAKLHVLCTLVSGWVEWLRQGPVSGEPGEPEVTYVTTIHHYQYPIQQQKDPSQTDRNLGLKNNSGPARSFSHLFLFMLKIFTQFLSEFQ